MEIAVNIKDKEGHDCGVYILHKFREGYFWSLVKFGTNHNLTTISKSYTERWLRDNNNYLHVTFPLCEEDLQLIEESTAWTT